MPIPSTPSIMPNVLGYAADTVQLPETTPTGQGIPSFRDLFPVITQVDPDAGGVMVERVWMNALFNLLGQHAFFQQSGCVYPWQATLDYIAGCHVLGSNGMEYIALQSSGPDISAGAKDPVQEANRTYWVSLTSFVSRGFVPNSRKVIAGTGLSGGGALSNDITISLSKTNSANIDAAEALRKTWIGIPRPWRSTTLPEGFVWADGGLVLFEDYPELKKVYNANGFSGMVLPYDADEQTIAANLGKWRPNAATPTGVYTPSLKGRFSCAWVPDDVTDAGSSAPDTGRGLTGSWVTGWEDGYVPTIQTTGALYLKSFSAAQRQGTTIITVTQPFQVLFDASRVWGEEHTGQAFAPAHIQQPYAIYLGVPA